MKKQIDMFCKGMPFHWKRTEMIITDEWMDIVRDAYKKQELVSVTIDKEHFDVLVTEHLTGRDLYEEYIGYCDVNYRRYAVYFVKDGYCKMLLRQLVIDSK